MNIETLKIRQFPNQMFSTIRFKWNYFEDNFLIEKYDDMTVKIDLETLFSEKIKTKK